MIKKVVLSDGKVYALSDGWRFNVEADRYERMFFYVETVCPCSNEDWKTALIRGNPIIPEGERLLVIDVMDNFYGTFIETEYKGFLYYLDPRKLRYAGSRWVTGKE